LKKYQNKKVHCWLLPWTTDDSGQLTEVHDVSIKNSAVARIADRTGCQ